MAKAAASKSSQKSNKARVKGKKSGASKGVRGQKKPVTASKKKLAKSVSYGFEILDLTAIRSANGDRVRFSYTRRNPRNVLVQGAVATSMFGDPAQGFTPPVMDEDGLYTTAGSKSWNYDALPLLSGFRVTLKLIEGGVTRAQASTEVQ